MTNELNTPIAGPLPSFQPASEAPPAMPDGWSCTALLQSFSPPQHTDPHPTNPFFELCVGSFVYSRGQFLSAQIVGSTKRTWWYMIEPSRTQLSTDRGATWNTVDMGWSLPNNWFGTRISSATSCGTSPLNWMPLGPVEWWKVPVPIPHKQYNAATWMWFDAGNKAPVRMMFGQGPVTSPTMGDPNQLAVFQMYSFTHVAEFAWLESPSRPTRWTDPTSTFQGFAWGNPNGYKPFVWNSSLSMSVFMTPVNGAFNPLPTVVFYEWKPDGQYSVATDRAQATTMYYMVNPGSQKEAEQALLFGHAPQGMPPPAGSDTSYLVSFFKDRSVACVGPPRFDFPCEPPNWVTLGDGVIQCTISNNPNLCPDITVTVYSVLFPPAINYPDSTYLWTWYAPLNSDGTNSRPITFMQSQSGVNTGTSLALADYFDCREYSFPVPPSFFAVPSACSTVKPEEATRKRRRGGLPVL